MFQRAEFTNSLQHVALNHLFRSEAAAGGRRGSRLNLFEIRACSSFSDAEGRDFHATKTLASKNDDPTAWDRQTYRPKTSVDRIPLGEEFFRDGGKDHGVGDVAAGAL